MSTASGRHHRPLAAILALLVLFAASACSRDDGAATASDGVRPSPPSGSAPVDEGTTTPTAATTDPARCGDAAPVTTTTKVRSGSDADHTPGSTSPLASNAQQFELSGRVVDGLCRRPLPGTAVWIYDATDEESQVASTVTDDDGHWKAVLPRGRYRVGFQLTDLRYNFTWYEDGPDFASAAEVALRGPMVLDDVALFLPEDTPVPGYEGEGDRKIAVIGDSLVQMGTTVIRRWLDLIGPTSVRGISGMRVDEMQRVAERYGATDPDVVVIALGNNDVNQELPRDDSVRALSKMISTFPTAKCVVVLDVNTHTPRAVFNNDAKALNESIAALPFYFPKVRVAPWDQATAAMLAMAGEESWFTDGLHLTPRGMTVYAKVMANTIATC